MTSPSPRRRGVAGALASMSPSPGQFGDDLDSAPRSDMLLRHDVVNILLKTQNNEARARARMLERKSVLVHYVSAFLRWLDFCVRKKAARLGETAGAVDSAMAEVSTLRELQMQMQTQCAEADADRRAVRRQWQQRMAPILERSSATAHMRRIFSSWRTLRMVKHSTRSAVHALSEYGVTGRKRKRNVQVNSAEMQAVRAMRSVALRAFMKWRLYHAQRRALGSGAFTSDAARLAAREKMLDRAAAEREEYERELTLRNIRITELKHALVKLHEENKKLRAGGGGGGGGGDQQKRSDSPASLEALVNSLSVGATAPFGSTTTIATTAGDDDDDELPLPGESGSSKSTMKKQHGVRGGGDDEEELALPGEQQHRSGKRKPQQQQQQQHQPHSAAKTATSAGGRSTTPRSNPAYRPTFFNPVPRTAGEDDEQHLARSNATAIIVTDKCRSLKHKLYELRKEMQRMRTDVRQASTWIAAECTEWDLKLQKKLRRGPMGGGEDFQFEPDEYGYGGGEMQRGRGNSSSNEQQAPPSWQYEKSVLSRRAAAYDALLEDHRLLQESLQAAEEDLARFRSLAVIREMHSPENVHGGAAGGVSPRNKIGLRTSRIPVLGPGPASNSSRRNSPAVNRGSSVGAAGEYSSVSRTAGASDGGRLLSLSPNGGSAHIPPEEIGVSCFSL